MTQTTSSPEFRLTLPPGLRLYTVPELTQMGLGSKNTIRQRIHEGAVPAVKVGRAFKVRETDLHYLAVPYTPASAAEAESA